MARKVGSRGGGENDTFQTGGGSDSRRPKQGESTLDDQDNITMGESYGNGSRT